MRNIYFLKFCLVLLLMGCLGREDNSALIAKYDNFDFSSFTRRSVYIRSRNFKEIIFFVSSTSDSCGPYVVNYDCYLHKIKSISNQFVIRSCGKNDLETKEITRVINAFQNLDNLTLLKVDQLGNVYISSSFGEHACLVRKAPNAPAPDERLYKKYKANWYITK